MDADNASRKMEAFLGISASGCLDHRTREEIARSRVDEVDTSDWVTIGMIIVDLETETEIFIRASQLQPKPHRIKARYVESNGRHLFV